MLVRDEMEKPNAFPALMVMLLADGPAFQVPLADVVVPDVSRTTDQALPSEVSSTETPQFVETQWLVAVACVWPFRMPRESGGFGV